MTLIDTAWLLCAGIAAALAALELLVAFRLWVWRLWNLIPAQPGAPD